MASTYVNDLRLNEMATGDQSGSWGTVTNTNLELIGEAFSYGTEAITTNADTHTTTIADGASDPGRAMFLKYTGSLDSACTITIGPNTVSKMWFIENATSGSQNIIISQGSGANVTIAAGQTKAVYSDGAGAGAAFVDAFAALSVAGVSPTELGVLDGITASTAELNYNDITTLATVQASKVVTADSNADVTFGDNDKAIFGAGSDLQIYHDGTSDKIESLSSYLILEGQNIILRNNAGTEDYAKFFGDGAVELYSDNSKKLATTSTGVDITGVLTTDGISTSADINFGDNDKAIFGAGSDLQIYHTGSHSYIHDSGTGNLRLRGTNVGIESNAGHDIFVGIEGGAATIYHNNAPKLATTATGVDITGTAVTDGLTVAGNLSVDGGTIKLDGNYPVGSDNVALGGSTLDDGSLTGDNNTAIGAAALTSNTSGSSNVAVGRYTMVANTTGTSNTALGREALSSNTTGVENVAIGREAMDNNTSGGKNVAVGLHALLSNTTAGGNTAVGYQAGYSNTTGAENVLVGYKAGYSSTTANGLTALGRQALEDNTASNNTAIGFAVLANNTSGAFNTALGGANYGFTGGAMHLNTTGSYNTALGNQALHNNTTASYNTAVGFEAGYANTTGNVNTAVGYRALLTNTTGYENTAVGPNSLKLTTTGLFNSAFGSGALHSHTTGRNNTAVGRYAGYNITTGSKNTILGCYNGNAYGLDIRTSSNNIVLSDGDGNPRALIDGSGNFVINNSAELGAKLTVVQTSASQSGGRFEQSAANQSTYNVWSTFTSSGNINTTAVHFAGYTESGNRFIVYGNGNVVNTNNSYGSTSDVKLKENIVDSGSQWDDIKALTVRKYSMKSDNLDAPNMLGVVAQEVEAAGMSGLVFESPDRDADNNDLGTVTKQVNYSILYMKAVKALQEAMDRIETLEADVAALKNP